MTDNNIMQRVQITQKKSIIDRSERQKRTLKALGLRKINHTVEKMLTPAVQGMINKVSHLVEVKKIS